MPEAFARERTENVTTAKWTTIGIGLVALLNSGLATMRVASTGISAHQMRTDLFYLGLAILGIAGALTGLWHQAWRPRGRVWWIVMAVIALAMLGSLLYVHAWAGGSYVHYDRGLPFPWIMGGAMVEGYTPPETGPVYWDMAPRGLLADLLIWTGVGYALAALVAWLRWRGAPRRSHLSVLLLIPLLLAACGPVTSASVTDPTATAPALPTGVPTPPPPPTGVPTLTPLPGTSTPVTPPSAYATQEAARQAAIVARATASPFPTAGPAIVQTGQPASATTQRDGLSFQVRLPKDTYLVGEGGQAEITLRNDGPETVFVTGSGPHLFWPVLLDERGHEPAPWPWAPMILPGLPYLRKLAPGQVVTETLTFQMPPVEQAAGHTYALWIETRFSRPAPDSPEGPDNLWLHLETGPISLRVTLPGPAERLIAKLEADRDGWHLRVTDATGQTPLGPLWGFREVVSPNAASAGPLQDTADGIWSGAWGEHVRQDDSQIVVRAWVAASGYVAAAITQTVPGAGDAGRMFGTWEPPARQTFPSLEKVQAALDFPLYRPGQPPDGAVLDVVEVETQADADRAWTDVHQSYYLPDDVWLELTQMVTTEHYASAGWGQARYAPEARPVTVGETMGYVVQQFGWWTLDWKVGDVGFELRGPVQAFSLEDLLALATGVQPPEDDVSE